MGEFEKNLAALDRHLERFRSDGVQNHVAGQDCSSETGRTFTSISPVDDSHICNVARGGEADVVLAVDAAAAAFEDWRELTGAERRRILHAVAEGIVHRADEIAVCESWDTGQPIRFMSKAAVRGAENFRFFADRAPGARDGQSLPSPTLLNLTTRVPIGPVGVITPWNTPFMLSTWKIAPALAAGCTVVHKPAELSPLTAKLLVEIAEDAGLPPGVLNVVNGFGEEAGVSLTRNAGIRAIAFVGESETGARIMKQGSDSLKRVHFELGGKNPVLVFDDADLDRALDAVIFMIYSLNGERCTSSSRLLVQKDVAEEFIDRLVNRVRNIRVGHPLDPATEIGPLIHADHLAKVEGCVQAAVADGARVAIGGRVRGGEGSWFEPTLIVDADPKMPIARDEVFGPVLTALTFDDEDEALSIANDVRYGLAGYVWTRDLERGLRVSQRLEAGMVWVNSENVRHLPTPFGGMKDSGIGRDGGDWSFEFYMEQKHIGLALGQHPIPRLGV